MYAHIIAILALAHYAAASCEPPVAFPPPRLSLSALNSTFSEIETAINGYFRSPSFAPSSCSIQLTSAEGNLWSTFHTANMTGRGADKVDGSTVYRIASNTKIFTAMAILQQHAKGKINLDDPIIHYVPKLAVESSQIAWNRVSVRSLLSHTSGLPNNYAQEDLLVTGAASALGLPPVSNATMQSLPACELTPTEICGQAGLIDDISTALPVFPPNLQPSYSNVGFDLLGLAVENITGMTYEEYVTSAILVPLGLNSTTFSTPSPHTGAIPAGESQWDADLGIDNAAGGLYSSSDDMARFMRYILKHRNTISPTIDWFSPLAYSPGSHSLLGAPWEIFRTTSILAETNRPVTFITKGGGLDGYYSYSLMLPDYDVAISILLAGDLTTLNPLLTILTTPLVRAIESLAQHDLQRRYVGQYTAVGLNSSINLAQSARRSLYITQWVSNGTDVMVPLKQFVAAQAGASDHLYFQVVPTFEARNEGNRTGEVWRFINVLDNPANSNSTHDFWNDYCVANFDPISYAGKPLNEVVFWRSDIGNVEVELSAFRVVLART